MSVESLRKRFLEEVEKNPGLYHEIDIERVKTEEWQVKRFLVEFNNDEDKAFELLCKAMKWKKEFGIHERDDQYFFKELWELTGSEISGRDKQGRLIQIEVTRKQYSFKELHLMHRQFLAHNLERVDRLAKEDGFILLMDTNGAGVSNVDLDMIKFKLQCNDLYPQGLRQMFVIDLPWILNPVMKVIMNFMSPNLKERLSYVKKQQLKEYIDPDQLPDFLGGTREKAIFPPNLVPLEECYERYGLDNKFVDYYYNFYKIKRTKK